MVSLDHEGGSKRSFRIESLANYWTNLWIEQRCYLHKGDAWHIKKSLFWGKAVVSNFISRSDFRNYGTFSTKIISFEPKNNDL